MAYVIQLEKVENEDIKMSNVEFAQKMEDEVMLLDDYSIIDKWEDDCVVGMGYERATLLNEAEFQNFLNEVFDSIRNLGGRVDEYNNIYFTNEFVKNLLTPAYERFVKRVSNISFDDFYLSEEFTDKKRFKSGTIFDDIDVYSDSFAYAETDFISLAAYNFTSSLYNKNKVVDETIPYRIVIAYDCY